MSTINENILARIAKLQTEVDKLRARANNNPAVEAKVLQLVRKIDQLKATL